MLVEYIDQILVKTSQNQSPRHSERPSVVVAACAGMWLLGPPPFLVVSGLF